MTLTVADREIRKGRIGASQVAALLGEGAFGSELTVWLELMDLPREDISLRNEVRAGLYLESAIVAWWSDDIGTPNGLRADATAPQSKVHARLDWLAATPDRLIRNAAGEVVAIFEAKSGGWYRADEWADRDTHEVTVPLSYQLQVQTQLEVMDMELAYVAAIIGGNQPFFGEIRRDREMWASMEVLLAAWHKRHVIDGIEPDPTGRDCDTRALRKLHPNDDGSIVTLSAAGVEYARKSNELKVQITELGEERERLRNLIRAEIKCATFAEGPGIRVSNKTNKRGVRTLLID